MFSEGGLEESKPVVDHVSPTNEGSDVTPPFKRRNLWLAHETMYVSSYQSIEQQKSPHDRVKTLRMPRGTDRLADSESFMYMSSRMERIIIGKENSRGIRLHPINDCIQKSDLHDWPVRPATPASNRCRPKAGTRTCA